ncbi:hypothetical protein DKP78_22270, partial [Enterococcus faecium]
MKDHKLIIICILFTLCTVVLSQHGFFPGKCCFRYYSKPIPYKSVKRILDTSPECVKPGYLVITKRGSLCADPE